jgi:hypothetical protein
LVSKGSALPVTQSRSMNMLDRSAAVTFRCLFGVFTGFSGLKTFSKISRDGCRGASRHPVPPRRKNVLN